MPRRGAVKSKTTQKKYIRLMFPPLLSFHAPQPPPKNKRHSSCQIANSSQNTSCSQIATAPAESLEPSPPRKISTSCTLSMPLQASAGCGGGSNRVQPGSGPAQARQPVAQAGFECQCSGRARLKVLVALEHQHLRSCARACLLRAAAAGGGGTCQHQGVGGAHRVSISSCGRGGFPCMSCAVGGGGIMSSTSTCPRPRVERV